MSLKICIYEDKSYRQFFPLTLTRPVYTLRPGIHRLFEKVPRFFEGAEICLAAREQIAPLLAQQYRDHVVNIIKRAENQDVLFLNGRIRDYGDLPRLVQESRISTTFNGPDGVVGLLLKAEDTEDISAIATPNDYAQYANQHPDNIAEFTTTAGMYNYCWDLMADIERCVVDDYEYVTSSSPAAEEVKVLEGAHLVSDSRIYLGNGVQVMPSAVIDASDGPVCIGDNARVQPQAVVKGPCYIGPNCIVARGSVSGSSIGHTCRLGGEVEASIFLDYVNKHHEGFIGHSIVGAWVNFGAMTTNSDLKNNYSPIRVMLNGQQTDSGSNKVGSFIGDHTKFGIGTLLTTGINIGICCNIFGGMLVTDKEVRSFSWGSSGNFVTHEFEKAMDTNRKVMERRDAMLTDNEINALRVVAQDIISDSGMMPF